MSHNWEHSNKDKHLTDFMTTKHSNALQVKEQDHDDTTEVLDIVQNDHSFTVKENQLQQRSNKGREVKEIPRDQEYQATSDQAELLKWHYRMDHVSFFKLRTMALFNIIPRRLAFVKFPKCQACCYGKQTKRPWRTKKQSRKIKPCTKPGECVSVGQLESSITGFVAQLKGKLTKRRYKCATVFVDHYSDLTYIHLHSRLTSEETVEAKRAFEAHARDFGVKMENYHCDNGRFADNAFIFECKNSGQNISYCSVNAHFQNGKAEKRIRDLRESARTMLLHAIARWPNATSVRLWPYAIRYASELRDQIADKRDGSCPLARFSGSEVASNMKNFHTFGSPVYTLENDLATGSGMMPHWHPRSRLGLYLGPSPRHARTVGLILNLQTGLTSPQFHVSYDDFFETVRPTTGNPAAISLWQEKAGLSNINATGKKKSNITTATLSPSQGTNATDAIPRESEDGTKSNESNEELNDTNEDIHLQEVDETQEEIREQNIQVNANNNVPQDQAHTNVSPYPPTTRSGRQVRWSRRYREGLESSLAETQDDEYYDALHREDYKIQDDMSNPISFAASSDPDTMYFHEAMKAPDAKEFLKAMSKEFNDHCDRGHWEIIQITEVPKETRILDAIWSMKRKRDIKTQKIIKYKARFNLHGGQQQHRVNYFETYSPVVNWFSVRLILVLSLLYGWNTRQVDFVLAYPQAPIECDLFMKFPKGIVLPGYDPNKYCLKLVKNIYGQK